MKTLIWSGLFAVIALAVSLFPEVSGGAFELTDRDADRALVGGNVTGVGFQCGPGTAACAIAPAIVNDCGASTSLVNCWTTRICSSCTVAGLITVCGPTPVTYAGTAKCDDNLYGGPPTPCGTQSESDCIGTWLPPLAYTCACPAGPFPATANPCGQTNCSTVF
jgi:hypothetical protein